MARFVLAGKADCPYYAEAEILADRLQASLPNFRIRKIPVLPDEWREWLGATCKRNGWKHERSPLVWRELVAPGGKGLLLGGFTEFCQHCQVYYNITSHVSPDDMLGVAQENLAAQMKLMEEEKHHVRVIESLQLWISSALNPACHLLVPNLLTADVFPRVSAISLHLLDLEVDEVALELLKMEMEDLALPLLHQVSIHSDLRQAFQEADVILLLDDWWAEDGDTKTAEQKQKKIEGISDRYIKYGKLINTRANREVKVIVSSASFVNLRCSLLLNNAHTIDSRRFVAMATQLENEARAILARKLKVRTSDVTDVIVWGNISGSIYIDVQRARVFNYRGPIKGPPSFAQRVLQVFYDRKWLETVFQDLVCCHRAAAASKARLGAAMTTANGILTVLKAWNGTSTPNEVLSVGAQCSGHFNLPDGAVLSVPVTFEGGRWAVLSDVNIGHDLREKLDCFASELRQEEKLGFKVATDDFEFDEDF